MSTSTVPSKPETPVFPAIVATAMVEIPLNQIEPSPFNRKRFNQQSLEELAANIVQFGGVLQPIVLRPVNKGPIRFQIAAGERRWKATQFAVDKLKFGKLTIPAVVREMTDAQAIEITLSENIHREDVHVLELNRTYRALLNEKDAAGKPYTREMIADHIKKSYSVVCAILQTNSLIPEIQKACEEGKIGSSAAMEIAKYEPRQQEKIFSACFDGMSVKDIVKDKEAESGVTVRELREWIANNIHIDLSKAPFEVKDEFLLKGVTSCVKCPKRTGSDPGLFADIQEVKKGDTCTDPSCYDAKKAAFVELKIAQAQQEAAPKAEGPVKAAAPIPPGVKPLGPGLSQSSALAAARAGLEKTKPAPAVPPIEVQKISTEYFNEYRGEKRKPDVLYNQEYQLAKPGCTKEKKSIWIDGKDIGKVVFICAVKSCSNHGYNGGGSGVPRDPITYERKLEIWNQRVQFAYRDELLKLIAAKLPGKIGDTEAALLAEHILKTLPHRDHEKVGRILGLEASDSESLELHMRKLKPEALMRLIVICSLVEDLGVDQLAFGGPLDKEAPLKIAAKAYKVDDEKLLTAAKAQLESKRPKSDAEKKAAEKEKAHRWDEGEKIAEKRVGKPLDTPKKAKGGKQVDAVKQAQERANKAKQKSGKTKKKK